MIWKELIFWFRSFAFEQSTDAQPVSKQTLLNPTLESASFSVGTVGGYNPRQLEVFPKHFSHTKILCLHFGISQPQLGLQQGRARAWRGVRLQEKCPQWIWSPQSQGLPSGKAPLPSQGWRNRMIEWKTWLRGENTAWVDPWEKIYPFKNKR